MTSDSQQRPDDLQEAADTALVDWYGHLPEQCEMRRLATVVFGQLVEYHAAGKSKKKFHAELHDATSFIDQLRANLNPLNPSSLHPEGGTTLFKRKFYEDRLSDSEKNENPEGWLSFLGRRFDGHKLELLALLEKGKDSDFYWPTENPSYECSEYLRLPWLQCERIDMLLVRAIIYRCVLDQNESMTLASLNPYTKAYRKRGRNAIVVTILGFLGTGLVGLGAASAYGWWAGLIAALGFVVLVGAFQTMAFDESRAQERKAIALQEHLYSAFQLTFKRPYSVVLLRERLASIDGGMGGIVPPDAFSILDCAISRGAVLWGLDS